MHFRIRLLARPTAPPRPSTPRTAAPWISARVGRWRVRSATSLGPGLARYGCVELGRLARAPDQRGLLVRYPRLSHPFLLW